MVHAFQADKWGDTTVARPRKWRRVCCMPRRLQFGPLDGGQTEPGIISMTIEEYETLRLIDGEDFTQEKCAIQMHVARTTVQKLYNTARKKLAEALVNGKSLIIGGGTYKLCDEMHKDCCCEKCPQHRHSEKTEKKNRGGFLYENSIARKS